MDAEEDEGQSEATEILVGRYQRGDSNAANPLFRRYGPIIERYLRGRIGPARDSAVGFDDIVQECLLHALDRLDQVPSDAEFRRWVLRVARNRATDQLRSAQRRSGQATAHDEDAVSSETPSRPMRRTEFHHAFWQAADAEPAPSRTILELYLLEGLTHVEIANRLGMSHAAVRRRYSRLITKLRGHLSPGWGASGHGF